MDIVESAESAHKKIGPHIRETELEYSSSLSRAMDGDVYLKLENRQHSGSFKYRGALNFILSLTDEQKSSGVITASTGNHAVACAMAMEKFGVMGTIYLPENASASKLDYLKKLDVELRFHGFDCVETETHARRIAEDRDQVYIPPYNHPDIISGQATIGVELKRQLEKIDAVFIPVGGGGLASGVGGYLKEHNDKVTIIGCQPENSPVMYESIKRGHIIEMESKPTLSDATAGGIESSSLTFDMCRQYIDNFVLINEDEIKASMILMISGHQILIEGAAALTVAALLKNADRFKRKKVVLIISGGRIGIDQLKQIL
jgi:threonine dehydratase